MKFRTSYLVGLMATVLAVSSTAYFIDPAVAADTPKVKPLKIMGPDGQIRQVNQQYGPTTSKDTFWSIAQKVRPDASVSVYQVMAALFEANPHAFNSDNYNSLERGMILLIPSKEVMLAIPNSVAIARAERDDKLARAGVKSPAKTTTPRAKEPNTTKAITQTSPAVAPVVKVEPKTEPKVEPKSEPVESKQDAVAKTATVVKSEPKMLSSDVNTRLEAAERKTLSLTDELARTQDQLSVRNSDVEALKAKVEELNQQIAVLEETLLASKQQNQALKAEVEAAQSADIVSVSEPDMPIEPDDLWRKIINNPAMLIAAAVIPALLILLLVFMMLRRKRNKERRELAAQQAAMAATGAGMATGASILSMDEDDLHDMAIHLDTDHADSRDSLLDVGSVSLQPEPQFEEDEGQSLDDLWAEAMGDQEEESVEDKPKSGNILEEEDLDALLAGLGTEDSANQAPDDVDTLANVAEASVDTDDFTDIETPENNDASIDLGAEIAADAELDAELDDLDIDNNDDIDALLADFDKLTPSEQAADLGEEIAAELDSDLESLGVEEIDDIDALLADFDKPTAPEPDLRDEIAAELDEELNDIAVADTEDIDTLLAGFDEPASAAVSVDDDVAQEIAAELEDELDTNLSATDDDLEQLLAEFDMQDEDDIAPHSDIFSETGTVDTSSIVDNRGMHDEIAEELEASLPEDLSDSEDDLDALLAEFDVPEQGEADSDDFNFDIETTPLDIQESPTDEDNLLKGIGASHALDGTDDTFTLVEDLSDNIDATAEDAKFTGFNSDDVNSDALTTAALAATVAAAASAKDKESSFFNDLKANKSKEPHVLDWDTELDFASTSPEPKVNITPTLDESMDASLDAPVIAKSSALDFPSETTRAEPKIDFNLDDELDLSTDLDLSDDSVLAAFTANTDFDDDDILTTEDSFALDDEHTLTVDEALAALDAQESRQSKKLVPEHDLTNFQNENGFIDIDKLLNDAEQDRSDIDLYPEVDIEMSDVGALLGDAAMIDVDDEENSVSAKLDLARAYIEIDDSDSAKALLKEVQIDGNEHQQDEAGRLLKEIS